MSQQNGFQPIILSKGTSQGTGSEEFRILLPQSSRGEIYRRLESIPDWGGMLGPLYGRTSEDLSRQYAILLADTEFGVFCVAPTKDSHRRRSLVIVGLVSQRNSKTDSEEAGVALRTIRKWIPNFSSIIAGGSSAVLEEYGQRLASDNSPTLKAEKPNFFNEFLDSNYLGAATPLFIGMGADVLIGTSHEALDAERTGITVNAYIDIRSGALISLQSNEQKPQPTAQDPKSKSKNTKQLLEEVLERLNTIDEELSQLKSDQKKILADQKRTYDTVRRRWF